MDNKKNKIELIHSIIERAVKMQKKLMIVGYIKNGCYFSYVVDPVDIEVVENPLYVSIQSLILTAEIDLEEKEVRIFDDADYISIIDPESETKFVIGII